MTDIEGPILNPNITLLHTTFTIEARESEPAVFYCRFIRPFSPGNDGYIFTIHIHAIIFDDCSLSTDNERIELRNPEPLLIRKGGQVLYHVDNAQINYTSSNASNVFIYESQVHVSSVTQILIAKCGVDYIPNGNAHNRTTCYSSSTLAIINTPNDTTCSQSTSAPIPSMTEPVPTMTKPVPTTTEPEPTMTETVSFSISSVSTTCIGPQTEQTLVPPTSTDVQIFSLSEFGSTAGVLCSIVAIETILLILFAYLFIKHKKSNNDEVVVIHHSRVCDAESDI